MGIHNTAFLWTKEMKKLIYGVGINDAGYAVHKVINGKRSRCPFYVKWENMLERCYSKSYQKKQKTYEGCVVSSDWLVFSNFKKWMESKKWEGMVIDKDLIEYGNKIYSSDYCVFIPQKLNNILLDRAESRGKCPIGVDNLHGKYRSRVMGFNKRIYLGCFNTKTEAHAAWQKAKSEIIEEVAKEQTDQRVRNALMLRACQLLNDLYAGCETIKP